MQRRTALRIVLGVALLTFAIAPPAALAGRGGGGKGGGGGTLTDPAATIRLVPLNSADGVPHFGQKVTFAVYTTTTSYPWVTLNCYRGGSLVYTASNGIFATSLNQVFTLGPTPLWQGGDADCTAYLENWDRYSKGKIYRITSMSFHVYA